MLLPGRLLYKYISAHYNTDLKHTQVSFKKFELCIYRDLIQGKNALMMNAKRRYQDFNSQTAKSPTLSNRASLNRNLAMSYSHMGTPTLPSALLRFTSEFGMESGGATALLSLDKKVTILEI